MQQLRRLALRLMQRCRPLYSSLNNGAQRKVLATVAAGLMSACAGGGTVAPVHSATRFPIDDGYTMSHRFEGNHAAFPEFLMPELILRDGQRILFDRRYKAVGARELHMDIFLPVTGQGNGWGVVLLHGGGWASGNKSNFYTIANGLAQRGYAVFLPEFRLSPEAAYPAAMQDSHDALQWVGDHAGDFGVDPARLAVGGESSGGQMATLLAYTGGRTVFSNDGRSTPRAAALLNIDGVMDFTTPLALHYENKAGAQSAAGRWLGGSFEAAPDRWREASGALYVDAQSPATLIISGGDPRFTAGMEHVLPALDRYGIRNSHVHFAGLPHTFWLFDPYAGQVVAAIDQFLMPKE